MRDEIGIGLISLLADEKTWKRYLTFNLPESVVSVSLRDDTQPRELFIAIGLFKSPDDIYTIWIDEVKVVMKLWEQEFGGKVVLHIGVLEQVEL